VLKGITYLVLDVGGVEWGCNRAQGAESPHEEGDPEHFGGPEDAVESVG